MTLFEVTDRTSSWESPESRKMKKNDEERMKSEIFKM